MTETCGVTAIFPPDTCTQYGCVGLPSPSVEIKSLDVPEAGYFATNSSPQGEILVRGASVTRGYYKRDDFISDEIIFMKDGWLRTRVTSASGIKNPMKLGLRGNYIAA